MMTENAQDIDALIRSLEDTTKPDIPFPYRMDREQEESIYGEREPMARGGRIAKFYRAEVELIKQDGRPLNEIAEEWGVSYDTILRVKERGRFLGVPYIPRDEVDRRLNYGGERLQPVMKDFPLVRGRKKGRPFKSGRTAPFTEAERQEVAQDLRHAKELAAEYNVSVSYIERIRREMGVSHIRRGPLNEKIVAAIKADQRRYEEIASKWKIPTSVVQQIKEARTHEENEDES
jgi:hypothetical protein